MVANGMAGVAGALYVFYVQFVYALDYVPLLSFIVVAMVILGGVANNWGVVIGAAFLTLLDFVTRPTFLTILGISARPPFDLNYLRFLSSLPEHRSHHRLGSHVQTERARARTARGDSRLRRCAKVRPQGAEGARGRRLLR
jgi:hypothetical protein